MSSRFLLAVAALFTVVACDASKSGDEPTFGTFGIDLAQMDTTVRPGDDFYRYVNGTWLKTFAMPEDRSRFGVFDALSEKSENDVRSLLEELAGSPGADGSVQKKVSDLYNSWMDTTALNGRGIAPLQGDLMRIGEAATRADIVRLMGEFDYTAPFATYIMPDPADPTRYTVGVTQDGLGMPNRDYYLNAGEQYDKYRAAYKTYATTILQLIGDADPAAGADAIIALEKKIAAVHWSPERQRDVQANNNPVDRAGLARMIPSVDWEVVLPVLGLGNAQGFLVNETTALRDGAKLLESVPVETWKKYLAFHLASDYAAYLPSAFDDASFAFFSKSLRGVEQKRDRWKRGVNLLDRQIGEAVGELYVAKYFPPEHKASMDELVENLRSAMRERLNALPWMDEATRAEAQKKLATFEPRIGYPSEFRDYSALKVEPGKLFENVRAARKFEWDRQVARLGGPVDRSEWGMNPQTVNAYYNPLMNQITFPAAILQAPFFDPKADPAVNYGAIGAVIGHEMGHGFDDQGREFDETGKIRNWWTAETNAKFLEATERLAAQYDAICPLEGLCINGRLTMGENIGDLGGLEMAYTAYRMSLNGQEAPVINGFTGDQRFFMAHAQVWRSMMREDAQRSQILTDPHSPASARGSIPEANMDAWYAAFGVMPGDKLYIAPDKRVRIW